MAMTGADTSCGVRPEGGSKGDDDHVLLVETVARIGGKLASTTTEAAGGEAAATVVVESSLRELQGVRMTFDALEATKIGRAVNALRKTAPSEQARLLAAALYRGWKALADERFRSSRTQQQPPPPPPPKADKQGIEKHSSSSSPPPQVDTKQAAGPKGNRVTVVIRRTAAIPEPAPATKTNTSARRNVGGGSKSSQQAKSPATSSHQRTNAPAKRVPPTGGAAPSTSVVGSRGGACKRKAEAPVGFDEAIVKKPRSLRVIDTNAPGKAAQPQPPRRVTVVIRRAAAATPEPAPATKTNTSARRNVGGGSKSIQQSTKCPATMASHRCTNAAAKRVSATIAAPSTTPNKPPPAPTAQPKPVVSVTGVRKRKAEATTVFDEARLARATARLHERYDELSAAKEKRKIKEIDAIATLRRKKVRLQRPAQHVRCTAAQRTGKKAPVPWPPPRMPRAF